MREKGKAVPKSTQGDMEVAKGDIKKAEIKETPKSKNVNEAQTKNSNLLDTKEKIQKAENKTKEAASKVNATIKESSPK